MNSASNGRPDGPPGQSGNGFGLAALIDEFEKCEVSLFQAIEINDDALITKYDADIRQLFNQIMEFPLTRNEDRLMLVEFLLGQLNVEPSPASNMVKSRIIAVVREGLGI